MSPGSSLKYMWERETIQRKKKKAADKIVV